MADDEVVFDIRLNEDDKADMDRRIEEEVDKRMQKLESDRKSDLEAQEQKISEEVDRRMQEMEERLKEATKAEAVTEKKDDAEQRRLEREKVEEEEQLAEEKETVRKERQGISDARELLEEEKELVESEKRRTKEDRTKLPETGPAPTSELGPNVEKRLNFLEGANKELTQTMSQFKGLSGEALGMLRNPQGFMFDKVLGFLNTTPYTATIATILGIAITSPEIAKALIRELAKKGRPLNRDWHRLIENETTALFSVEQKKKLLLGLDSFVVTQQDRFLPSSGQTTRNSLENRHAIIVSRVGLAEKAVNVGPV